MPDIIVEPVGEAEQTVLDGWLDDAARWNIDVTDVATIDAAYESYVDRVIAQDETEREDPTPFVAMIGFALGQWLTLETVLEWRVITDAEGRDIGVVDLRSIVPFDDETVCAEVRRTGRAVVVAESAGFASVASEIVARVTERCFHHLEAPIGRVTGFDIPYPPPKLERHFLPGVDRILDAVDALQWEPTAAPVMS